MTRVRLGLILALLSGLVACKDSKNSAPGDAGGDAGRDASSGIAHDSGTGAKQDSSVTSKDSGTTAADDAGGGGDDAGSTIAQTFKVPATGGVFDVTTASGAIVKFDFPASAGGKAITATAVNPAKLSWGNTGFAAAITDAIELGPDGTKFADPIKVTLPNSSVLAFTFSAPGGVPNPLRLSADKSTLELVHFSTLGIVAPNQSCESQQGSPFGNGWTEDTASARCTGLGAKTNYRHYGCKNYQFCYTIEAGCCVAPGAAGSDCKVDDANLALVFNRANNGAQYAYCAGTGDTPYVQSATPSPLVANSTAQIITLTGFGFASTGSVFINSDAPIATQWVSSTKVTATVPGTNLTAAGTLGSIGFVNPLAAGGFNWNYRSNMVDVPINAPALVCPVPEVGVSPIGVCTITSATDCSCAEDYDSGGGYHTYEIVCSGTVCECKRDSVLIGDGAIATACADKASAQAMWTSLCVPLATFCP